MSMSNLSSTAFHSKKKAGSMETLKKSITVSTEKDIPSMLCHNYLPFLVTEKDISLHEL
ncbi:hypothetical protein DPMN_055569 [Dreissena polymorpha]|uniref:Uncharacterized protein n=1 Tax=Dreissena polymorpha TaxID=45954 RepID=A0A9D4HQR9_DREPO|nr:hypothetical protein DPMN_055569 [Dreissena polymorpha]